MRSRWFWNFPRHRAAHRGDWADINVQLAKIGEELAECVAESCDRNARSLTMELMDVIHAAETALVIVNGPDEGYLEGVKGEVIEKNRRRGYYEAD